VRVSQAVRRSEARIMTTHEPSTFSGGLGASSASSLPRRW
jgi:hypothetical protein